MPKVVFQQKDKEIIVDEESNNLTILEIAQKNGIEIEGSCEGSLACSTCHIIVDNEWYDKLDEPSWDEEDMLDLATGLTITSRLGCQITLTDRLDGLKVALPVSHNDVRLNKKKY
ncbi:MAG TPA: 2Fe-2S iron-sulfur cluster binding domain-containing protein [Alphaproteobacteria bacterium]|nr:2Fe-2S iron-sulfur cluster binding domain-containing protein [Alphaproteobacteria bacterium]HIK87908.1 2Fe-2S iron-sulfur cluster binding domain-containing protein [Alphaproteobacteria bacterium]